MFDRADTDKSYTKYLTSASGQQQVSTSLMLKELQNRGVKVRDVAQLNQMIKEHLDKGNLPHGFKPQKKYSSFDHGPVDHYPQWVVDFLHEQSDGTVNDPLLATHFRSREERQQQMTRQDALDQLSKVQRSQALISPEAAMRQQRMANRATFKKG